MPKTYPPELHKAIENIRGLHPYGISAPELLSNLKAQGRTDLPSLRTLSGWLAKTAQFKPLDFTDPGLTDSQGNPCSVICRATAWAGFTFYIRTDMSKDFAVFSGDAYKRFLAWMVTR